MAQKGDYEYIVVPREEYRDLVVAKTKVDVLSSMIENYKYMSMGEVVAVLGLQKKGEEDK